MRVVTSKEMKELEAKAAGIGVSPLLLMENAAVGVASVLRESFPGIGGKKVVVLCGRGNNGGDGLAVARHLFNHGTDVKVVLVDGEKALPEEAAVNLGIVKNMEIPLFQIKQLDSVVKDTLREADIIIDGLFGTGLSRKVNGVYLDLINYVNSLDKPVSAIDIPSGINADSGEVMGEAIKVEITVALGFYKPGHLLFPGRGYCGRTALVDISIPECLSAGTAPLNKIEEAETKKLFKKRRPDGYKNLYGHVVLIGGSPGKTGAVVMAANAAMRCGAGLATVVCPHSLNYMVENARLEIMSFPAGDINGYISFAAVDGVIEFVADKDVIVIGPGLSSSTLTEEFFVHFYKKVKKPMVIDADGINLMSRNRDLLKEKDFDLVLTPHAGEMARLANINKEEILKNPVEVARTFAVNEKVFLVLKSATTVFATPDGRVYLSVYGNPGMATAGTGDLLSGIIGGFMAQGYKTEDAVILALTVHGLSADMAKNRVGETAMMATDILEFVPELIKTWEV